MNTNEKGHFVRENLTGFETGCYIVVEFSRKPNKGAGSIWWCQCKKTGTRFERRAEVMVVVQFRFGIVSGLACGIVRHGQKDQENSQAQKQP